MRAVLVVNFSSNKRRDKGANRQTVVSWARGHTLLPIVDLHVVERLAVRVLSLSAPRFEMNTCLWLSCSIRIKPTTSSLESGENKKPDTLATALSCGLFGHAY